jgi:hypothetical protein
MFVGAGQCVHAVRWTCCAGCRERLLLAARTQYLRQGVAVDLNTRSVLQPGRCRGKRDTARPRSRRKQVMGDS